MNLCPSSGETASEGIFAGLSARLGPLMFSKTQKQQPTIILTFHLSHPNVIGILITFFAGKSEAMTGGRWAAWQS